MLTLFTLRTKSVDEASTMVKSLFTDFTKASTIKGFKSAGIDMFDASGQLKQADVLLRELNRRFIALGDNSKAVVALKNQFTGSEGLIALINAATDRTGALESTLRSFENSVYDEDSAIKNMMNDTVALNEILKNKLGATMVQLGTDTLNARNQIMKLGIVILDWVGKQFRDPYQWAVGHKANLDKEFDYVDAQGMTDVEYNAFKRQLESRKEAIGERMRRNTIAGGVVWDSKRHREMLGEQIAIDQYLEELDALRSGTSTSGVAAPAAGSGSGASASATREDILKTLGGGSGQKTINVQIGSLIDSQTIQSTTLRESLPDITRMVEEAIVRAVGGAEQMLATS